MILAGDIGGTNCRLAIFDRDLAVVEQHFYQCRQYDGLDSILREFMETYPYPLEKACFGLPGPIQGRYCQLISIDWEVEAGQLEAITNCPVILINDVEANAYGLATLRDDEIVMIKEGKTVPNGNRAVFSPGTGLGQAALIDLGEGLVKAMASEGGHTDFGPLNALQWGLIRHVQREFKRISYEMIVSGPGLVRMYNYLVEKDGLQTPDWLADQMEKDAPAAISQAALSGNCSVCDQALDLYIAILAAEAGNVALKFFAKNGVYLGGGIPVHILDRLKTPLFEEHFTNKDKMTHILKDIPVYVILNQQTALQGTARHALSTI